MSQSTLRPPASRESAKALASPSTNALLRRYATHRERRDLELLADRFRPLARRLALQYARPGEPLDDLEQVANLGLVKALQRFDPERGFAFTSFAVPTILGEIKRSFRDTSWALHVPRVLQERSARIRSATDKLETEHGRPPTVRELCTALGENEEDVLEAMGAGQAQSSISLDAPVNESGEGEMTLADHVGGPDDAYEHVDDLAAIAEALPVLTEVQREVLHLRFEQGLLQSDIAKRLGVSQMQISRTLRAAIERLQTVTAHHSRVPTAA